MKQIIILVAAGIAVSAAYADMTDSSDEFTIKKAKTVGCNGAIGYTARV